MKRAQTGRRPVGDAGQNPVGFLVRSALSDDLRTPARCLYQFN
jgi:hypothetical protein